MSPPKRTLLSVSAELAQALCIAAIGGFVGFLIGDDSRELRRLQTELDKVESQLVTSRSSSSKHEARRPGFFTSPQTIQTTNTDLDLSREEKRKLTEERIRREFIAGISLQRSNEYVRVFSELGVPSERIDQLRKQLAEIHDRSFVSEGGIVKLLEARNQYRAELHSLLGNEKFERYRQYEESKPALAEYGNLSEFLKTKRNSLIDPAYEQLVLNLLYESKAYVSTPIDGPFDSLPAPAIGTEMIIARLESDIAAITERSNILLQRAVAEQVPEEIRQGIVDFYGDAISTKQKKIEWFKKPQEERNKRLLIQDEKK